MLARVRKKLLVLFFVFSIPNFLVATNENDTVVMKINNATVNIQPRAMISQYNSEMKEKNKLTDRNVTENLPDIPEDENLTFQRLQFPHNLQIVGEVLKKLKNEDCVKHTTLTLEAMTNHERWALEMFDSFSKFPMGILYGNYYQLGNFDECIGVKKLLVDDTEKLQIQGQYCLTDIHFEVKATAKERTVRSLDNPQRKKNRNVFNNTVIHWGICLPASCTTEDARVFTSEIFASAAENFEVVTVNVEENKCYVERPTEFTIPEIIYGCIAGSILIFSLLATALHYWYLRQRKFCVAYNVDSLRAKQPNILREIITCFSVIHTVSKFLQTKPNELNLECICGIKFISMSLIIAGHSLIFILGGPIVNKGFFEETSTQLENGPLLNNPLLVDTFLLVSGFLMCRLLLMELDKRRGKVNFFILYIARYIRLTPAYVVVIGLYMTMLYRFGSGPFWNTRIGLERDRCWSSWWTNILYINNYVNTENLCMFQSWYLAVDYHLFILAPFVIYPMWKWSKLGESLIFICTALSAGTAFWITYQNNLDPTLMAYPPEIQDISTNSYFANVYIKTHMRASSYCIGVMFGYVVHKLQASGTKIPSYAIILGWALATALGVMSMYSIVIFYNPTHEADGLESAIYASLHRIAWCLAIGWVLLTCITDNAAIINKFLSWKAFIPASRLTYCAYLANGLVEVYNMGVVRQSVYLSKYELACRILGHTILTYAIAFLLCIFFESPIHGIEKILLRREKVKEIKQNSTLRPVTDS